MTYDEYLNIIAMNRLAADTATENELNCIVEEINKISEEWDTSLPKCRLTPDESTKLIVSKSGLFNYIKSLNAKVQINKG